MIHVDVASGLIDAILQKLLGPPEPLRSMFVLRGSHQRFQTLKVQGPTSWKHPGPITWTKIYPFVGQEWG